MRERRKTSVREPPINVSFRRKSRHQTEWVILPLALIGHSNRSRVCPLLGNSDHCCILAQDGLVANDPMQSK
jgi:hypothetical protein